MVQPHSYSKGMIKKNVGVIGVLPPVLGGVSVHVERVVDELHRNRNTVTVFNPEQRKTVSYILKLIWWVLRNRHDYIIYHATYGARCLIDLLIVRLCAKKESLIVVEHDCRHMYKRSAFFKRWYAWILQRAKQVVFIGNSTKQSYDENAIAYAQHSVESAFLPPSNSSEYLITAAYPSSLDIFLRDYTPVVLINAAHLMRINGNDVYGLDVTLQMLAHIKKEYPDVGLLMVIGTINDPSYWNVLRQQMNDLGIAEHVYVLQGNYYLWPLFKRVDLFVRPTLSDGESISLQEALYFKVPAIATTSVERPEGVHLFETNDMQAYAQLVHEVLKEKVYGNYKQRHPLHAQSPR